MKAVKSRGYIPFQTKEQRNAPNYLSSRDAKAFLAEIKNEKDLRFKPKQEVVQTGLSGVYAVEAPSYDGTVRLKIGWSDDIENRLNNYRTLVPDLRVRRVWSTTKKWCEDMALTWAVHHGSQIAQEVFELPNIDAALSELDTLFSKIGIRPQEVRN